MGIVGYDEICRWNYDGPIAIRYPRGEAYDGLQEFRAPIEYGKSEVIYDEEDIVLLAVGKHGKDCRNGAPCNCGTGVIPAALVNARFVKPVDKDLILDTFQGSQAYL